MKCLLLFSLALFELLHCHTGSALFLDEDCERNPYEVLPTTAPWMAAVSNEQGFLCGGTLITKSELCADCRAMHKGSGEIVRPIGGLVQKQCHGEHRDYEAQPGPNDIGLLKLNASVKYTYYIQPICILMKDAASVLRNINTFSAFGWGVTETGESSKNLMTIKLRRRPSEECQGEGLPQLTNSQFCAESEVGSGPCNGDGGGPLAAIVKNRTVQVGIISYGRTDCTSSSVYTDVASYTDWIASHVYQV